MNLVETSVDKVSLYRTILDYCLASTETSLIDTSTSSVKPSQDELTDLHRPLQPRLSSWFGHFRGTSLFTEYAFP